MGSHSTPERHIILCDKSGSMMLYNQETESCVGAIMTRIEDSAVFNVAIVRDSGTVSLSPRLIPKLGIKTSHCEQFFAENFRCGGDGMLEGIAWAIGQRPDHLWILSDGDVADIPEINRLLSSALTAKPFRVSIVQLGPTKGADAEWKAMADRFGGLMDSPGKEELRLPAPVLPRRSQQDRN